MLLCSYVLNIQDPRLSFAQFHTLRILRIPHFKKEPFFHYQNLVYETF